MSVVGLVRMCMPLTVGASILYVVLYHPVSPMQMMVILSCEIYQVGSLTIFALFEYAKLRCKVVPDGNIPTWVGRDATSMYYGACARIWMFAGLGMMLWSGINSAASAGMEFPTAKPLRVFANVGFDLLVLVAIACQSAAVSSSTAPPPIHDTVATLDNNPI